MRQLYNAFVKPTNQGFWVLSIIIGQFDFTDLGHYSYPSKLGSFPNIAEDFEAMDLDQIRTAVEDTDGSLDYSHLLRFQEFSLHRALLMSFRI